MSDPNLELAQLRVWLGVDDKTNLIEAVSETIAQARESATGQAGLTFKQVIDANLSRVEKWHSLRDWSPLEWAGAMCGEAGEAANFAKKLKRLTSEIPNIDSRQKGAILLKEKRVEAYQKGIGCEVADTIIYGVLLCARVDVDLVACIREVFNAKSEEYGFPERL